MAGENLGVLRVILEILEELLVIALQVIEFILTFIALYLKGGDNLSSPYLHKILALNY
jgi:hypothetical protein